MQRWRPFSPRLGRLAFLQRIRDLLRDLAEMLLAKLEPDRSSIARWTLENYDHRRHAFVGSHKRPSLGQVEARMADGEIFSNGSDVVRSGSKRRWDGMLFLRG